MPVYNYLNTPCTLLTPLRYITCSLGSPSLVHGQPLQVILQLHPPLQFPEPPFSSPMKLYLSVNPSSACVYTHMLCICEICIYLYDIYYQFSSVQSLGRVQLFSTPWIAAHHASLSITNSWSSLKLTSIKSVMLSSHLILCRPLLLLPPIPPSITVFSNESTLHIRWPNYWSFSFSIIPSKEIPGLIFFRLDWLVAFFMKTYPESKQASR